MTTSERLLNAASAWFARYDAHPFIKGIEHGNLAHEKFRCYIVQDYLYLQEYAKVFAIGLAKAQDTSEAALFERYIGLIYAELARTHEGYLGRLGVSAAELASAARLLPNTAYTSYMLRVAYEGGVAEILAAIYACAVSYSIIAKNILTRSPNAAQHDFYGPWVTEYASAEFATSGEELGAALNHASSGYDAPKIAHLEQIFLNCCEFEYNFWQMGWEQA